MRIVTVMRVANVIAVSLACLTFTGCSWLLGKDSESTKQVEQRPKEVPLSAAKPSELSEEELFFRAKRYYEAALYRDARENFDALRETYPLGAYAEFAEIKSTDALFDEGAYSEAAARYEELARNRPLSEAAPYLLFRAARSAQLSQRGVGRDMSALDRSQALYEELLNRFPTSRHAIGAKQFLAEVLEAKASYTASIRDFYARQGKNTAATSRDQRYQEVEAPQALFARTKAEEASRNVMSGGATADPRLAALRQRVERDSQAQTIATVSSSSAGRQVSSPAATPLRVNSQRVDPLRLRIVKLDCRATADGRVQAAAVFNREFDISQIKRELTQGAGVSPTQPSIQFIVPGASLEQPLSALCGSLAVVSADTTGVIKLQGNSRQGAIAGHFTDAQLTSLPNPPRLLILARP